MFVAVITVIWFILICDLLSISAKQLSFDLVHILKITELLIMITSVGIDSQWEKSVVEYKWGVELKKVISIDQDAYFICYARANSAFGNWYGDTFNSKTNYEFVHRSSIAFV